LACFFTFFFITYADFFDLFWFWEIFFIRWAGGERDFLDFWMVFWIMEVGEFRRFVPVCAESGSGILCSKYLEYKGLIKKPLFFQIPLVAKYQTYIPCPYFF
jgi:hypothetical protein